MNAGISMIIQPYLPFIDYRGLLESVRRNLPIWAGGLRPVVSKRNASKRVEQNMVRIVVSKVVIEGWARVSRRVGGWGAGGGWGMVGVGLKDFFL
jgi:hypothetical protein